MRHLGIDYGTKRIGLALSDESGSMAFPCGVLANEGVLASASHILDMARAEKVGHIVLGRSLNYKREENPIMKEVEALRHHLEAEIAVSYEDETGTSAEANRSLHDMFNKGQPRTRKGVPQGQQDKLDASAAAVILNSFLAKQVSR